MMNTTLQNKIATLWQELRRRRVVRVALFYGAFAWVFLQIADIVLEAFEADAALKYFIAAVVAGFPLTLVLSWMFNITPGGIERTAPVARPNDGERSIAVLPFTNFSDDPGNEYFSDGLSEEIRNQLAKVPGVRVAARTSSFAFKGRNEDVREIGRRLDVGLILEGGVRKHENTVRISVQLVDTGNGYQMWADTFERRLEDIFAVQTEISNSILEAVHGRVLDRGPATQPTEDFEAYNLYLLGRHHFHKRTEAALERAITYFEQAIARDPGFALAYSGLADSYSLLTIGYYGNLCPEESIARALPAAERALELAPASAEANASIGLIQRNQKDLEGAAASLSRAVALDPNYSMAHVWSGLILNAQGRYTEAAEKNADAFRRDPLSPIINTNAGYDAARFGSHKDAETRFRNAMELDPSFAVPYSGLARLKASRGALDEAFVWSNRAVERAPTRAFYLARKGFLRLQLGDSVRAEEWILAAHRQAPDNRFISDARLAVIIAANDTERLHSVAAGSGSFSSDQQAQAAWLLGDEDAALTCYSEHCPDYGSFLRDVVNDDWVWRLPHAINFAHLRLRNGETAAASELSVFVETLEELWRSGIMNPDTEYWAVSAFAILERHEDALVRFESAIERGWRNVWWARRDPNVMSLAGEPKFEALLSDAERRIEASAKRVRTLESEDSA